MTCRTRYTCAVSPGASETRAACVHSTSTQLIALAHYHGAVKLPSAQLNEPESPTFARTFTKHFPGSWQSWITVTVAYLLAPQK